MYGYKQQRLWAGSKIDMTTSIRIFVCFTAFFLMCNTVFVIYFASK